MKNGMKKTAAVVMAAMLMGTGAVMPAAEDMGIFSQTAIVAEAASVGKVTGLKSKTLSNSEIQLSWNKGAVRAVTLFICAKTANTTS